MNLDSNEPNKGKCSTKPIIKVYVCCAILRMKYCVRQLLQSMQQFKPGDNDV
ncbi:hypothetical protein MNBD_GAMMA10-120 [hydrothermal vent metagenome]|uniref:Uncharacterized protein n=1 Tax=hydrothermal vent metagenome TaxID=652676 RepID=A0A3B0XNU0_9ZZZZ